ncbi:tail tube protein [Pararheinheimera phage vB_PsoM_KLER1-1]|nr:tail tube protein [Pararheinheimera phage vB_PsoM_KLER1-1]
MANQVPEKLNNFMAYNEGQSLLGVADVELPSLEAMTETVSGAGIAGEVDSPTLGHYGSMTTRINFRTITSGSLDLAAQMAHQIEFRGSQQIYDAGSGQYLTQPVKVVMKCVPKNIELGNFTVGAPTETGNEFEVNYLKIFLDGKAKVEIDKFNFIANINGKDYLESVRRDLGIS